MAPRDGDQAERGRIAPFASAAPAMLQHLVFTYRFNLDRARTLIRDLSDAQMVRQPHGVVNHPAWTLGHLAQSSDQLAAALGLASTFPAPWKEAFRTGGVPSGDAAAFPAKDALVAEFAAQHERVARAIEVAAPAALAATLAREHPNECTRTRFPTIGDYAFFLITSHEGSHLGQIAAWRRAMGLGSATGI